jgi:dTDP-4-dehydrorhamnose 3,5-epimerase-like enzyme
MILCFFCAGCSNDDEMISEDHPKPTTEKRTEIIKQKTTQKKNEVTVDQEQSKQQEDRIKIAIDAGHQKKQMSEKEAIFDLKMNVDQRGSFTELVHTLNCGQVSINISKPGVTKGEHWHNTKWEQFIVVSGHGLIQLRKEGTDEVLNYEVSGEKIQSVIMLPGYTHNIINLSDTEDLVTVMYCNEVFNPNKPDTYFDKVEK